MEGNMRLLIEMRWSNKSKNWATWRLYSRFLSL